MPIPDHGRVRAFALQSQADFDMWVKLKEEEDIHLCHALLFLQMACEKLCKSFLYFENTSVATGHFESSHGYTEKQLPLIIQRLIKTYEPEGDARKHSNVVKLAKQVAAEICYLSPAVGELTDRPDNCEYPWQLPNGEYTYPAEHGFTQLQSLLLNNKYRQIMKYISASIRLMCERSA